MYVPVYVRKTINVSIIELANGHLVATSLDLVAIPGNLKQPLATSSNLRQSQATSLKHLNVFLDYE